MSMADFNLFTIPTKMSFSTFDCVNISTASAPQSAKLFLAWHPEWRKKKVIIKGWGLLLHTSTLLLHNTYYIPRPPPLTDPIHIVMPVS